MSGPLRNMNNQAREIVQGKFKELLLAGFFPKVEYSCGNGFTSYNMIEYSTTWARVAKVAHEALKAKGFEYGLYQNARNQAFLSVVTEIAKGLTADQINASEERFQKIWG